jgi:hypothetical protein
MQILDSLLKWDLMLGSLPESIFKIRPKDLKKNQCNGSGDHFSIILERVFKYSHPQCIITTAILMGSGMMIDSMEMILL